ncbi:hypothetical protein Tco_0401416 [Tanacetum coccineum]
MSQHKSISKRQGSSYHTVDNDGILYILKFINKGEEGQVYGKPIPSTLVTNDITAYKTFIGISTGLIPPKKGRGKGAQGTKATVIPKKATSASKKKKQKKKVSIRDESSDEESEEQEERLVRLVRKPRAAQFEIDTQKAMKASKRTSRFQHQSGGSSEGADWGSTDDETFLFDDKDEKITDIPWKSTDDDDEEDESDDDKNIDIEKTDDERTDTDVEDQVKGVAEMNIAEEVEEENTERFINSPNAYLIGTIPENAEAEINSLLDIQIQQDDPHIQQEPFHVVKERVSGDDQNEDPSAGSNQGKKTQKRRVNESESSKKTSTATESSKGKSSARTSKFGKSATAKESVEEPIFEVASDDVEQTLDDKVGDVGQPPHTNADETQVDAASKIPKKDWFKKASRPETLYPEWNTVKTVNDTPEQSWLNEMIQNEKPLLTFNELMIGVGIVYNIEECYHALTDQLDWANPEVHKSLIDMSKPLPLQDKEGRLTIPIEFFFINDLGYLKAGNKDRTYSSSITKTPAASVVNVLVEKRSGYGYLKGIMVRRVDQNLYKIKEGDFPDLHVNGIEDMLLLIAQNKLFNLDGDVIVDFVTALKMFTRGIIVKNRVEDVHLGVESYQRKLNLTKPQRTCQHISVKEPYTPNYDPPGLKNFKLGYNPMSGMPLREWTERLLQRTV